MGGGSGGRAKTQTTEQGGELPVDGGGRVFQVRVGGTPQAKDGSVGVRGVERHPPRPENPADVPDGRREGILQQTRDEDVESTEYDTFPPAGIPRLAWWNDLIARSSNACTGTSRLTTP